MGAVFKQYEADTLKKLQQVQTSILSDFIEICEQNNWTYFVFGGTALGTVRHHGFIPWDDDVDVIMPRKDYEAFISSFDNASGRNRLLSIENEPEYVLTFSKLIRKGTVFREKNLCEHRYESGIYIDIFAYDATLPDLKKRNKQINRTWMYKIMCMANRYRKYMDIHDGTLYGLLINIAFAVSHGWMKVFRISKKDIYSEFIAWATKYNDTDSGLYVNFSENAPKNELFVFSEADIFPLKKMAFETITVNVMNHYDKVLTDQYGDYMTLPPEEQRFNHCPEVLVFGDEINMSCENHPL